MKFTVQSKAFVPALRELRSIISDRGIPSLACVRIRGAGEHIEMTADNFEVRSMILIPAKIEEDGGFLVSASKLSAVLANAGDEINFDSGTKTVDVISGLSSAKLHTLPLDEFIAEKAQQGDPVVIKMGAGVLSAALRKVSPAMTPTNREMVDGIISGVHIVERAGKALFESTNRAAIHFVSLPLDNVPKSLNFRISRCGVEFLEEMDGETMVLIYENNAVFKATSRNVSVSLLEGEFPNTLPLIPKEFTSQIIVDRDEFSSALRYAANFSTQVEIKTATAGVMIIAISKDGEEIKTLIPGVQKQEFNVSLYPMRLVDALSQVQTEEVTIRKADHSIYVTDGDFSAAIATVRNNKENIVK